jgi:predicted ABC-type ATPase
MSRPVVLEMPSYMLHGIRAFVDKANHRLQGRTDYNGVKISIEHAEGSTRSGVDADGHPWSTQMVGVHYGRIIGVARDGGDSEHVDVFLRSNPNLDADAYVIHLKKADKPDEWDEDKVFLGFDSAAEAKAAFNKHYDSAGQKLFNGLDTLSFSDFKKKLDLEKVTMLKWQSTAKAAHVLFGDSLDSIYGPQIYYRPDEYAIEVDLDHPGAQQEPENKPELTEPIYVAGRDERVQQEVQPNNANAISPPNNGDLPPKLGIPPEIQQEFDRIKQLLISEPPGPMRSYLKSRVAELQAVLDTAKEDMALSDAGRLNPEQSSVRKGGYIAVDLDGTLAEESGGAFDPDKIGPPVPVMIKRVKNWLADGKEVKIFTARIAGLEGETYSKTEALIKAWCYKNIGQELPVICEKDPSMLELWDNRAVAVETNTGKVVAKSAPKEMLTKILVTLRDPEHSLQRFLEWLKRHANPGHSFVVIGDPGYSEEEEGKQRFGFDGDGAFYVHDIEVTEPVKKEDSTGHWVTMHGHHVFIAEGTPPEFQQMEHQPTKSDPNRWGYGAAAYAQHIVEENNGGKTEKVLDEPARQAMVREIFDHAQPPDKPELVFTGGPTGAGKSTAAQSDGTAQYVHVDADDIKARAGMTKGDDTAKFHEQSSKIAKECCAKALDSKFNLIYDSRLANYGKVKGMIDQALDSGYRAVINYTHVDAVTSCVRTDMRAAKALLDNREPRIVSRKAIAQGANDSLPTLMHLYDTYKNNPNVNIRVIDNSVEGREAKPIFEQQNGVLHVHDHTAFSNLRNQVSSEGEQYGPTKPVTETDLAQAEDYIRGRVEAAIPRVKGIPPEVYASRVRGISGRGVEQKGDLEGGDHGQEKERRQEGRKERQAQVVLKNFSEDGMHYVFGEVYTPMEIDTDTECMTAADVRRMAYEFVSSGKINQIDVMHNKKPCGAKVVESYIARDGDPDFKPGTWVMCVQIPDGPVWDDVKNGDLNGFSFHASVNKVPITVSLEIIKSAFGQTEPNNDQKIIPPHMHSFFAEFGDDGRVISGATDNVMGHSHQIKGTVITETVMGHNHRYQI